MADSDTEAWPGLNPPCFYSLPTPHPHTVPLSGILPTREPLTGLSVIHMLPRGHQRGGLSVEPLGILTSPGPSGHLAGVRCGYELSDIPGKWKMRIER